MKIGFSVPTTNQSESSLYIFISGIWSSSTIWHLLLLMVMTFKIWWHSKYERRKSSWIFLCHLSNSTKLKRTVGQLHHLKILQKYWSINKNHNIFQAWSILHQHLFLYLFIVVWKKVFLMILFVSCIIVNDDGSG
jgi:hypothetical protein